MHRSRYNDHAECFVLIMLDELLLPGAPCFAIMDSESEWGRYMKHHDNESLSMRQLLQHAYTGVSKILVSMLLCNLSLHLEAFWSSPQLWWSAAECLLPCLVWWAGVYHGKAALLLTNNIQGCLLAPAWEGGRQQWCNAAIGRLEPVANLVW